MGAPMGTRLMGAGYPLKAYDPSEDARSRATGAGAAVVSSPQELSAGSDVVITMLPDGPAVAATAETLLAGFTPGALWIEMTSSDPKVTAEVGAQAVEAGVQFVDAPVTGGVPRATRGELTAMAAGPQEALTRARPILELLASKVIDLGEAPGLGDTAKAINNLLSAANLLIAAEGLGLARSHGLDPERFLEVINGGTGQSNATTWKIPEYVLSERFDAGFTIGQYLKDMATAIAIADRAGAPMEVSRGATAAWRAIAETLAASDHTFAAKVVADAQETRGDRE